MGGKRSDCELSMSGMQVAHGSQVASALLVMHLRQPRLTVGLLACKDQEQACMQPYGQVLEVGQVGQHQASVLHSMQGAADCHVNVLQPSWCKGMWLGPACSPGHVLCVKRLLPATTHQPARHAAGSNSSKRHARQGLQGTHAHDAVQCCWPCRLFVSLHPCAWRHHCSNILG